MRHPRYGEGEVAGFGPGRGTVRVWFAGAGLKALPYPCAELAAVPLPEGEEEHRSLTLDFDRTKVSGVLPLAVAVQQCADVDHGPRHQFLGAQHGETVGAAVTLTSLDRERMGRCITGRGGDGRCRWRHTFLSGLKTAVRRDYGLRAFVIAGRCVFDGPGVTAAG